ncbi:hypothetical protein [Paludisphaera mucosa]|uniref:Uncharacterized protein n=1 Tax=Paludisphaera mucosa TaxID=3030827 RepID=A0ABT6FA78_9BACT|nr:hypothetical protein [Paludisphaera mucosa]MDG3004460.1 hypothetical protein [Paludisphaera mucosa]
MPSMLNSLAQGFKNYKKIAQFQLKNNTVKGCYDEATNRGTSRPRAVGLAMGIGAATFLAPPVIIGAQAVKDYHDKQRAEMQRNNRSALIHTLQSNGISQNGAIEIAELVIMSRSAGNYISMADFKMWKIVSCVKEPSLERYTHLLLGRLETEKPELGLA